jgi:hypothetical protein
VYRRRLLAGLSTACLTLLAGCDGAPFGDLDTDADADARRPTDTATASATSSLPYLGPRPRTLLDDPRGIRLRNATGEPRLVTLALDRGDEQVFLDTREVPPATLVRYDRLVGRRDDYRVVVETGAGARHVRSWTPAPWAGDLLVTTDREVTSRTTATCGPDCGPATDALDDEKVLVLDNPGTAEVAVDVRLGAPWAPDLDRRYAVPGADRLALPVPDWSSNYPVQIGYGDRTVDHEWRTSDGDRIYVSVAGPPRLRCSNAYRELVVVNRLARDRELDLRIEADGDPAVQRSLAVGPESRRSFQNDVPPAGRYAFQVRTTDGLEDSFETSICPAAGPMLVILDESAAVVTIRGARRERAVDGRA